MLYGVMYIIASLFMSKIVKPTYAKLQIIISTVLLIIILCIPVNKGRQIIDSKSTSLPYRIGSVIFSLSNADVSSIGNFKF